MKKCKFCEKEVPSAKKCDCEKATQNSTVSKKIIKIGGIGAVVIALAITIFPMLFYSPHINAFDYVEVSFNGINNHGTLDISFEKIEMIEAIIGEEPNDLFSEEYDKWESDYEKYAELISVTCSKEENLSNGDIVKISVNAAKKAAKFIEGGTKSYTVDGLIILEAVDVFENVTFEFEGVNGDGSIRIIEKSKDGFEAECSFVADKANNLSNGDKITVEVDCDEETAIEFGCIPKTLAKELTVSGLPAYLTDKSEIPTETIKEFSSKFAHDVSEEITDDFMFTYGDVNYYGTYFMTKKEDAELAKTNRLEIFVCYERFKDGDYWDTVYMPLVFTDILIFPDGTITLDYENGSDATFTTDMDDHIKKLEEKYTVQIVQKNIASASSLTSADISFADVSDTYNNNPPANQVPETVSETIPFSTPNTNLPDLGGEITPKEKKKMEQEMACCSKCGKSKSLYHINSVFGGECPHCGEDIPANVCHDCVRASQEPAW